MTGGATNGVGYLTYTATATDRAGNPATKVYHYHVSYKFDGFLQPVNDTAHQVGTSTSIFRAGSTVPMKFQLKRADGTLVQTTTAPVWLVPAPGASMSVAVNESTFSDPADSQTTFRWDSAGQQYIYNWGTGTVAPRYYYRVGVRLDDGNTYTVIIGLR